MVGVGLAQEVDRWQLQGVVTNVALGRLKNLGPKIKYKFMTVKFIRNIVYKLKVSFFLNYLNYLPGPENL